MAKDVVEDSKAQFVRRWGEMASFWGINRTMAEIHAMLFVATEPHCTDDVMEQLQVSRGNASTNLRALVDWGLIDRIHLRGDRKEYFVCRTDVWQMFETIVRQRRRREIEPIFETLAHCREMVVGEESKLSDAQAGEAKTYLRRLDDMHSFLTAVGTMIDLLTKLGPKHIGKVSKMIMKFAK